MLQSTIMQKDDAQIFDSGVHQNSFGITASSTQEDIVDLLYDIADCAVRVDGMYHDPLEPDIFEVSFDGIRFQPELLPTCSVRLMWSPEHGCFIAVYAEAKDTRLDFLIDDIVGSVLTSPDQLQQYLIGVGLDSELIE